MVWGLSRNGPIRANLQIADSRESPNYHHNFGVYQRQRDDNKIFVLLFEGGSLGVEKRIVPKRCFSWETPRQ